MVEDGGGSKKCTQCKKLHRLRKSHMSSPMPTSLKNLEFVQKDSDFEFVSALSTSEIFNSLMKQVLFSNRSGIFFMFFF